MEKQFLILACICCIVIKLGLASKDAETYEKIHEGRKLTGQSCNPNLLRPCRYQTDFCVGIPPTCTTEERPELRLKFAKKTTKRPTTTTIPTTTEIISTTTSFPDEEAPSPHKIFVKSAPRPKKSLEQGSKKPESHLRQQESKDKSIDKSKDKSIDKSIDKSKDKSIDKSIDKSKDKSIDKSKDKSIDKPKDKSESRLGINDPSDQNEIQLVSTSVEVVGTLTWNGKVEEDKPCLLDDVINEVVNGPGDTATKDKWIADHKHEICDYNKLQVCTVLDTNETANAAVPDNSQPDDDKGVCRCIESSLILFQDTCYIPAGLGFRSGCGIKRLQYKHVPGSNGGQPTVKPQCFPNAECVSSPEYFGLRCACVQGVKFYRGNHTCSSADCIFKTQNMYSISLLFLTMLKIII